jgi:hypothetical protein
MSLHVQLPFHQFEQDLIESGELETDGELSQTYQITSFIEGEHNQNSTANLFSPSASPMKAPM